MKKFKDKKKDKAIKNLYIVVHAIEDAKPKPKKKNS